MKYLIVVAHPDDEVLGAGASIWKWAHNGGQVDVCIMCTEAKARAFRPEDKELDDDLNASSDFLGIGEKYEGTFPNQTSLSRIILRILTTTICRQVWPARRRYVCSSAGRR